MKKNNYKKNKNTGMTLIEMIIYVSIFSMVVISFISFQSNMTATRINNQRILEINDQGQKIMKIITQTIRNSNNVNTPTVGNSSDSLNLNMYDVNINPTIFSNLDGILYIQEGGGPSIALNNNKAILSNLNFSNFSSSGTADIIKISFTLSSPPYGEGADVYSYVFNSSAQLRK